MRWRIRLSETRCVLCSYMKSSKFLSQDREKVMKAWLLTVVDPPETDEAAGDLSDSSNNSNNSNGINNSNSSIEKRKKLLEKKALETEELPFLLQSGVLLCRFSLEGDTFFNSCFIFEGSSTSSNLPMALPGPNSPQGHYLPREATSGQHISIYQYIKSN